MKSLLVSVRLFALLTLVTGLVYPAVITVLGQGLFPDSAGGSLVEGSGGIVRGSRLIGQEFKSARYFHGRPSAVSFAPPSGGSNLGPTSAALRDLWNARRQAGDTGLLLAASGSGLDPHIDPPGALAQVARVARARALGEEELRSLVAVHTEKPELGLFGAPRVNVLELNLALDAAHP